MHFVTLRRVYKKARKMLFTKDRPVGPFFAVDATVGELNAEFGRIGYGPNWAISYNFRGEAVNLAYRFYEEDDETGVMWWQVHIRGWTGPEGLIYLRGHVEAEPTEYPEEHMDGIGYDKERGMFELENALERIGIPIRKRVAEAPNL